MLNDLHPFAVPPRQLVLRWAQMSLLEDILLGTKFKSWTIEGTVHDQPIRAEHGDFIGGFCFLNGRLDCGMTLVGCGGEDPAYVVSATERAERAARRVLSSVSRECPEMLPEIQPSMGWTFAMYWRACDREWHDATSADSECTRYRYLDAAIAIVGDPDTVTPWVVEQYEVEPRLVPVVDRILRDRPLSPKQRGLVSEYVSWTAEQVAERLKRHTALVRAFAQE